MRKQTISLAAPAFLLLLVTGIVWLYAPHDNYAPPLPPLGQVAGSSSSAPLYEWATFTSLTQTISLAGNRNFFFRMPEGEPPAGYAWTRPQDLADPWVVMYEYNGTERNGGWVGRRHGFPYFRNNLTAFAPGKLYYLYSYQQQIDVRPVTPLLSSSSSLSSLSSLSSSSIAGPELVGHWTFDNGTGDLQDRSGFGHHATASGMLLWSQHRPDIPGNTHALFSVNSALTHAVMPSGDAPNLTFARGQDFSIAALVQPAGSGMAIVKKMTQGEVGVVRKGYELSIKDGKATLLVGDGFNTNGYRSVPLIPSGKFTSIVATYDWEQPIGQRVRMYLDGTEIAVTGPDSWRTPVFNISTTVPLTLFATSDFIKSVYRSGYIDDVRIYRGIADIGSIPIPQQGSSSSSSSSSFSTGLMAHWPFDSGQNDILDRTGNNIELLTSSALSWSNVLLPGATTATPALTTGSNGGMTFRNSPSVQFGTGEAFTVSAWVRLPNTSGFTLVSTGNERDFNNYDPEPGFRINVFGRTFGMIIMTLASPTARNTYTSTLPYFPSDNAFHHFLATYDPSQPAGERVTFYLDTVSSHPSAGSESVLGSLANAEALTVLKHIDGTGGDTVDDLRIYRGVFTPADLGITPSMFQ